ncbi:MAG: tryptophan dimethylallyltransferase family protein [Pseudonocardiaceae bacterium]
MTSLTLRQHTGRQLRSLCGELYPEGATEGCVRLLRDMVGRAGSRSVAEPALWPSFVSDDHTPVEFSLSFDRGQEPNLRVLVEHLAAEPTAGENLRAARRLTNRLARRYGLSLDRFEAIADLFLPDEPQGCFSLWHSAVLRPAGQHEFKVYLNPAVRGAAQAPALVAQALERLGLHRAYATVAAYAFRPGWQADRFVFLGLDLSLGPHSRVKVYVAHDGAVVDDTERAARPVRGTVPGAARDFCRLVAGSSGPFTGRPLLSCYAFVDGDGDSPSGYTLHLPLRDYVTDDEAARSRVATLLHRQGSDPALFDRALKALVGRRLDAGAGLISYVSLRMGPLRPGVAVYLSSEAYGQPLKASG